VQLSGKALPTTFPIFLVKNIVFYDGTQSNCCDLGYHSAFNNPSFGNDPQTYAIVDCDSSGDFGPVQDSTTLSHEVAERANDPYVNNPTPAWGHTGQITGCQSNLEDGDPLSGTVFPVTIGTKTYHLQELAFFGWFFDYNGGVNGWYSTQGSFLTGSSICSRARKLPVGRSLSPAKNASARTAWPAGSVSEARSPIDGCLDSSVDRLVSCGLPCLLAAIAE
jgi:hypothetical protein